MKSEKNNDQFIAKSFDTKIDTIEKKYGVNLGVSEDKTLGEFLLERGYTSLARMLQEA